MASAETARLIASLELQDKNFTRGLKNVERGISKVDRRLGAVSGAVNRNLARGIDTVISKGSEFLVGTVKDAADFETAITGVAKTVEGDISGVTDELKKLSTQIPLTFVELAGIAELGGAMGIAKEDLVAFTEQVAILGTTTDVSTEDAATALGQLQNVIGLTGDEFDNFAASLVDLGNKGASTESQILEIAKRSGGAAKLVGVAKEETLGWASAAANLGLNSELAGTALQNFFIKGAQAQAGLAKVAGVNVKKFKKLFAKDATGALQLFLKGLGKLDKEKRIAAIQEIFGKGSGLTRLILGLAGDTDNLTESLEDGTEAWEKGTAAQEEAEKRFKTSESLFKRLDNSVKIVSATIGEALLPVLNDLATEAIDFLNKPGTQKGIKNFAKSIGEGVRSLAKIVTAINWGAVAGFLGTAAGFAGQLVTWFGKMPDWAQAFLIGGFAVTKLPIIGDLFSSLASGLIKGVLGINAGIVNVNGPVAGGPMGGPGGAAPAGKLARIANAVKILGAVTIAGASIALLAQQIGAFIEGVQRDQAALQEKVNRTNTQNFAETIANLKATNAGLSKLSGLDEILASVTGGGQITQNFEMAADRIVKAQGLTRTETLTALSALSEAQKQAKELNLKTPGLDKAIATLVARLNKPLKPTPGSRPPGTPPAGTKTKPAVQPAGLRQSEKELASIKSAVMPLPAGLRTAETAINNVKTATTTLNTTASTGLTNVNTTALAGNTAASFHSAANVIATGSTTTAVNTNAAATRLVAPSINPAIYAIGASISAAIWASGAANKPVIQSTNVVNNYSTTQRTGSTSGSRNGGALSTHRG